MSLLDTLNSSSVIVCSCFKWFSTVADQKIVVGVSKEIKLPKLILFNGMSATYNYWNNLNRQHPNNLVQSEGEINRLKL